MLIFETNIDNLKVVAKIEEVADAFASSLGQERVNQNKKECFLGFTKENQLKWCKSNFKKSNIHLLKSAKVINIGEVVEPHQKGTKERDYADRNWC